MITFSSLPLPSPFHPETLRPSSSKPGKLRSRKLAGSNASVLWIWVNRLWWSVSMFRHSIICLKFKHQTTVPIELKGIMIHDPSWSLIHHINVYMSIDLYDFIYDLEDFDSNRDWIMGGTSTSHSPVLRSGRSAANKPACVQSCLMMEIKWKSCL